MNCVEIKGNANEVEELLSFVETEDSDFDFNIIVPIPDNVENTQRGSRSFASEAVSIYLRTQIISNHLKWMMEKDEVAIENLEQAIKKWESEKKIDIELGYRIIENRAKYNNCGDCYEWCIEYWGTKSVAWDIHINNNSIYFDTAWTPCTPVIQKLAELYPGLEIEHSYFEPGVALAGVDTYKNGELIDLKVFDEGTNEYRYFSQFFYGI